MALRRSSLMCDANLFILAQADFAAAASGNNAIMIESRLTAANESAIDQWTIRPCGALDGLDEYSLPT